MVIAEKEKQRKRITEVRTEVLPETGDVAPNTLMGGFPISTKVTRADFDFVIVCSGTTYKSMTLVFISQ